MVQAGRATLVDGLRNRAGGAGQRGVRPGRETHTFTDITEDLALVVVFAPRYGSRAPR